MILVAFTIYSFIICRKKAGLFIAISITALIGLMINVLAPGNSVRADNNVSLPAFAAIIESIKYTINCIFRWTGLA